MGGPTEPKEPQLAAAPSSRSTSEDQDQREGLLPVVKFLQGALAMKAKGDNLHYQHVVAQLITRNDPETLWRLYLGLCECVNIISRQPEEFKELMDALFRFDWSGDEKVVSAFTRLLTHLVSANGTCMVPAMHMLVRNLVLTVRDVNESGDIRGATLTRQQHVHAALQATLALVPSGRPKLAGVLRRNYPHRRMKAEALSDYALQALRVVQYAPLVEESVVRLILEKCLEIDVEIKITETGEAVVDDEEEEGEALFTMDDIMEGTADTRKEINEEVDEMADKLDRVMLVLFTYLDQRLTAKASVSAEALTDLALDRRWGDEEDVAAGGIEKPASTALRNRDGTVAEHATESIARLLQSLLVGFEENILPTYRSKFVQFVLFFACGHATGLGHAFVARLLDTMRDDSRPKLIRHSSVAYLASFLARASYVEPSTVSQAVGALLEWADGYLDLQPDTTPASAVRAPGPQDFQTPMATRMRHYPASWHGVSQGGILNGGNADSSRTGLVWSATRGLDHMLFYSVCQATFYVMCFRGSEMVAIDAIASQAAIWERLLSCSLQPLKHCLGTVRREFARLCCNLMEEHLTPPLVDQLQGIADERDQVAQTITAGASFSANTPRKPMAWTPTRVTKAGGLGRGSNPLDSFFPFDPYLLRRSHVYVDSMYNTWKSQEEVAAALRRQRRSRARAEFEGDASRIEADSDMENSDDGDLCSLSSGGEGDIDDTMDVPSLGAKESGGRGLERSRRPRRGRHYSARASDAVHHSVDDEDTCSGDDSEVGSGRSRKIPDSGITDCMSVTSSSSVAVGSLMGRSLGTAMASSFADDGLVWGGGNDDAFFHENVSPSASPILTSGIAYHAPSVDTKGSSSRRTLF